MDRQNPSHFIRPSRFFASSRFTPLQPAPPANSRYARARSDTLLKPTCEVSLFASEKKPKSFAGRRMNQHFIKLALLLAFLFVESLLARR